MALGPLEHGYRNPTPVVCVYELNAAEFPPRCSVFDTKSGLVVLLVENVALGLDFSEKIGFPCKALVPPPALHAVVVPSCTPYCLDTENVVNLLT
jgi:hypothetical protein